MPAPLAILCATRGEAVVRPFLQEMVQLGSHLDGIVRFVAETTGACNRLRADGFSPFIVSSVGISRHERMQYLVDELQVDYCLILDDDECCTPTFVHWLTRGEYRTAPQWQLPRAWLWQSAHQYLVDPKHWPDHQVRLAARATITIPTKTHGGWIAPVLHDPDLPATCPHAIEHHKFLIRSRAECAADSARYESQAPASAMPKVYLPVPPPQMIHAWPPSA